MSTRLFGTDGIRGRAGDYPLDERTIARIGAAVVRALPHASGGHRILVGRDTRESGRSIEEALTRGARSVGAHVVSGGVLPTPAVAYLTRSMEYDLGVVISASHNPYQDNGIKVFSGQGEKFDAEQERDVEEMVADDSWDVGAPTAPPSEEQDFVAAYIVHARTALTDLVTLRRSRILLDCANGATTTVAPRLFRELGFDVTVSHAEPNGRNINLACGSTHPDGLGERVVADKFRLGIAFDGDGDRVIMVDHNGKRVDGDAILLMCGKHLKAHGELRGNAVVATVMSNLGLELGLKKAGIQLVRTPVGDKHVAAKISEKGLALGGEQSGHIIFADFLFTGDGMVTALNVLRVMAETGRELADLAAELKTYPQVLVNVRVQEKADFGKIPAIADVIARVQREMGGQGRLLIRYSGTEPLLRIMLEGTEQAAIEQWAEDIATAVRAQLG